MKKRIDKKYKFYEVNVFKNGKLISSIDKRRKVDAINTARKQMSRLKGDSYNIRELRTLWK